MVNFCNKGDNVPKRYEFTVIGSNFAYLVMLSSVLYPTGDDYRPITIFRVLFASIILVERLKLCLAYACSSDILG